MATTSYSVEDFVHDIKPLMEEEKDIQRLLDRGSVYLEKLVRNPDCVPENFLVPNAFGTGRPNHGTYNLYQEEGGLSVSCVVWGPGDHASPHDHHTWGMIGLLNNRLTETRFRRLDDGSKEGWAQIEQDKVGNYKPGEITLLIPDIYDIHQMDNFTDRPTAEIHVYGQPLAEIKRCRFNMETGEVLEFQTGKADNE